LRVLTLLLLLWLMMLRLVRLMLVLLMLLCLHLFAFMFLVLFARARCGLTYTVDGSRKLIPKALVFGKVLCRWRRALDLLLLWLRWRRLLLWLLLLLLLLAVEWAIRGRRVLWCWRWITRRPRRHCRAQKINIASSSDSRIRKRGLN